MSKKHEKVCVTLNHIEHFLILGDIGCISTSAFTSLLVIPIEITNSVIALKVGAIAIGTKKYKSIIKKKKDKHDEIVLIAKSK